MARQRLGENITAATITYAAIDELLDVFLCGTCLKESKRLVLFRIYFFDEFKFYIQTRLKKKYEVVILRNTKTYS
jgi:hypothetical protein